MISNQNVTESIHLYRLYLSTSRKTTAINPSTPITVSIDRRRGQILAKIPDVSLISDNFHRQPYIEDTSFKSNGLRRVWHHLSYDQ